MTRFKQYNILDADFVAQKLQDFFQEDHIDNDITTNTTQNEKTVVAQLIAREELVFAGVQIIQQGFINCAVSCNIKDGDPLQPGDLIASIEGPINDILKKERVVLNLIQRLCGIASITKKLSSITKKHNIELLDTRKTTPGLRMFEKFAVAIGGGTNHRFSLQDAVMIKDNHLKGNPDIIDIVSKAKASNPNKDIQVEVDTKEQLDIALRSEANSILLDNFNPQHLIEVVKYIRGHNTGKTKYIEISGGITAETLAQFCIAGIDGISMGALTHNIQSKDIGLDI
jgi:nicotinate-nucleotide pyrophosphorylase (carboxylating)